MPDRMPSQIPRLLTAQGINDTSRNRDSAGGEPRNPSAQPVPPPRLIESQEYDPYDQQQQSVLRSRPSRLPTRAGMQIEDPTHQWTFEQVQAMLNIRVQEIVRLGRETGRQAAMSPARESDSHINSDHRRDGVLLQSRDAGTVVANGDLRVNQGPLGQVIELSNRDDGSVLLPPATNPNPAPRRIRRTVLATLDVPEGYHPFNDIPLDFSLLQHLNPGVSREFIATPNQPQPHPSFFAALGDEGVHREPDVVVDEEGAVVIGDAPPVYTEFEELTEDVMIQDEDGHGGEELPGYVEVEVRSNMDVNVNISVRGAQVGGSGVVGDVVEIPDVENVEGAGSAASGGVREEVIIKKKGSSFGQKLWKGIKGFFQDRDGNREEHGGDPGGMI